VNTTGSADTMRPCINSHRIAALLALLAIPLAHADDTWRAGASVQRDARDNQLLVGTLQGPLPQHAWWRVGAGQSRNQQPALAHRASLGSLAVGHGGDAWAAAVQATHRRDGSRYRQTDTRGTLEWRHPIGTVGLDAAYRNAALEGTVATPTPQGGTADVPVAQRIKGSGFGLHGALQLSPTFEVFAAAMRHDYKTTTRQNGSVSGAGANDPLAIVSGLLGNPALLAGTLQTRASAVSRDEAALSRSAQLGATYRWTNVALTGEYLADRVLDSPGTVRTVQLKAALEVTPSWSVTPLLGRTRSDAHGSVGFGGLAVAYGW
jgi:hypothetical protein